RLGVEPDELLQPVAVEVRDRGRRRELIVGEAGDGDQGPSVGLDEQLRHGMRVTRHDGAVRTLHDQRAANGSPGRAVGRTGVERAGAAVADHTSDELLDTVAIDITDGDAEGAVLVEWIP